jgi:hypothetical protein
MKDAPTPASQGPTLLGSNSKPSGALKLAFRLPIYLYRVNLGWLPGHRILLLIHQGRKIGLLGGRCWRRSSTTQLPRRA